MPNRQRQSVLKRLVFLADIGNRLVPAYIGRMSPGNTIRVFLLFSLALTQVSAAELLAEIERPGPLGTETGFVLHFEDSTLRAEADAVLTEAADNIARLIQARLDYSAHVYVETDLATFERRIGGRFPDWGAAAAIPERRMIVIKSPLAFRVNRSLRELLGHELSHLVLHNRLRSRPPPRWFDEGLAMLVSAEWGWSDNLSMSKASVFDQLIPLEEISGVNQVAQGVAAIAYAESYLAVAYFFEEYGPDAVNLFLDSLADGSSLDAALLASTGSNQANFNLEFQLYLQQRYNLMTLFTDTMYFWLALAIILIVGAGLKYRRRKEYFEKWERDEELHSTDFDYGDPNQPEQDDEDEPWRS